MNSKGRRRSPLIKALTNIQEEDGSMPSGSTIGRMTGSRKDEKVGGYEGGTLNFENQRKLFEGVWIVRDCKRLQPRNLAGGNARKKDVWKDDEREPAPSRLKSASQKIRLGKSLLLPTPSRGKAGRGVKQEPENRRGNLRTMGRTARATAAAVVLVRPSGTPCPRGGEKPTETGCKTFLVPPARRVSAPEGKKRGDRGGGIREGKRFKDDLKDVPGDLPPCGGLFEE